MSIDKSTAGLIDHQFKYLEQVADEEDLSLEKKIGLVSKLVTGIRGISALNLAHMREMARQPDLVRKHEGMRLGVDKVNGADEPESVEVEETKKAEKAEK